MARPRSSDPVSSDDDAPEVVSHSLSKRNAKRVEKTLRGFEAGEHARKKAQNRERDRKLKERAVVTRVGRLSDNGLRKSKQKAQRETDAKSDDESDGSVEDGETPEDNSLEMRMRRAMQDAAAETGHGNGGDDQEDLSDEEIDEGSGESGIDEEMAELDAESELEEEVEVEDGIEDESADEDEDQRKILPKPLAKAQYLEEELFASAFASQNAHAVAPATKSSQKVQPSRKRQRRPLKHAKDLLVGTRTIRTLLTPLGSNIRSTAHTIPSQKIRKFIDRSLAVKGRLASAKAKARGWERRPANVGVMKCTGAPSGFVRGRQ